MDGSVYILFLSNSVYFNFSFNAATFFHTYKEKNEQRDQVRGFIRGTEYTGLIFESFFHTSLYL